MPLPTIESIKTTIETKYNTNIHDKALLGYSPMPGLLGPLRYPGGFGVVFPLINASGQKYAFRVWHREIAGIRERTNKIAQYLKTINLPYFVEFDYVQGGLTVEDASGSQLVDTVHMEWVEGDDLHAFLNKLKESGSIVDFKAKTMTLADNFKRMFKDMHQAGISHGDLQHGNVVIKDDLSIKLVDYDSIYVPALKGESQITCGLSGYQHPLRKEGAIEVSAHDDYFSELIIYSGLLVLSILPELWPDDEDDIDNFSFLFTEKDFDLIINETRNRGSITVSDLTSIRSSALFNRIIDAQFSDKNEQMVHQEVKELMALLVNYLNVSSLLSIKPLKGTAVSRKSPKYEQQNNSFDPIDADGLAQLLADLGGPTTRRKINTKVANVVTIATDTDVRKDKYRNQ